MLAHGFLGQVVGQVAEGRRGPWAAPADLLIPLRCAFPPPPASSAGTFTVGAISGLIIFSRPLWLPFLTQGLNPGLLNCGQILYHQSHQGSPYIHDRI